MTERSRGRERSAPVAHRARTVHTTSACFWLVAGIVGVAVVAIAGIGWDGIAGSGVIGAVVGGLGGTALSSPEGSDAPLGARLATVAQTRRRVLCESLVALAGVLLIVAVLRGAPEIWWSLATVGLAFGLGELAIGSRLVRWERHHPDDLLAERLGWRRRRFSWRKAWGDQAPHDDQPARPRPGRTVLVSTGIWPSRDPEDYR
jgi:hypothetical protein